MQRQNCLRSECRYMTVTKNTENLIRCDLYIQNHKKGECFEKISISPFFKMFYLQKLQYNTSEKNCRISVKKCVINTGPDEGKEKELMI